MGRLVLANNVTSVGPSGGFAIRLDYVKVSADIIGGETETQKDPCTSQFQNKIRSFVGSLNANETFLKLQYDVTLHQVDYPNEHFENCKKSKPDFLVPGAFYYLRFLKVNQSFFQWMPNTLPSPWLEIKGKLEFGVAANNKVFHSNILIRVDLKEKSRTVETDPEGYKLCDVEILDTLKLPGQAFLSLHSVFLVWSDNYPVVDEGALGSIFLSGARRLYSHDATKDFTIVAGKGGAEIRCHSTILQQHSDVFGAMMNPSHDTKEAQQKRVELPPEFSEKGVGLLVKFLYGQQVLRDEVPIELASELFQLAHLYEVEWLEEAVVKLILGNRLDWFRVNPDAALSFYLFIRKLDPGVYGKLKEKLGEMIARLWKNIRSCERYKRLNRFELGDLVEEVVAETVRPKKLRLDNNLD